MKIKIGCTLIAVVLISLLFASCSQNNQGDIEKIIYKGESSPLERTVKKDVVLGKDNVGNLKESELLEKIKSYAQQYDTEVKNASIDSETWQIAEKEKAGRKININETLNNVMNAEEGKKVNYVKDKQKPEITAEMLKNNIVLLSSYTTQILDHRSARMNNIQLASEKLDFEIVLPGNEFSFNQVLGSRTKRKGYEKAPIFIKTEDGTKKTNGIGGGICQLSSTLYNAADKIGLNITEKHSHSKTVGYVSKGRDATVAQGSMDFRFVNNRKYPIMIRVFPEQDSITVRLIENRNI